MDDKELYLLVKTEVTRIRDAVKESMADGKLTVSEVLALLQRGVTSAAAVIKAFLTTATDAERKQLLKDVFANFYREVIKPIDLLGVPNFIVEPAVDNALESMIPYLVDAAYDSIDTIFDKIWPLAPSPIKVSMAIGESSEEDVPAAISASVDEVIARIKV